MAREKIYGILSTLSVEIPPATGDERAETERLNQKFAGLGVAFRAAAKDYGFTRFEDTVACAGHKKPDETGRKFADPVKFQSGDIVRIFRTVSKGDVFWQGAIDLDRAQKYGQQKDVPIQKWAPMFIQSLPAKLEKEGHTLFGSLEPYNEAGMEGVAWALCEYGKPGYNGLNLLKDGDNLTVYGNVYEGDIAWQGRLEFGPEDMDLAQKKGVMRLAKHMNTGRWIQMCSEKLPVAVIKGAAAGPS